MLLLQLNDNITTRCLQIQSSMLTQKMAVHNALCLAWDHFCSTVYDNKLTGYIFNQCVTKRFIWLLKNLQHTFLTLCSLHILLWSSTSSKFVVNMRNWNENLQPMRSFMYSATISHWMEMPSIYFNVKRLTHSTQSAVEYPFSLKWNLNIVFHFYMRCTICKADQTQLDMFNIVREWHTMKNRSNWYAEGGQNITWTLNANTVYTVYMIS